MSMVLVHLGKDHIALNDISALDGSFYVGQGRVLWVHSGRPPMAQDQRSISGKAVRADTILPAPGGYGSGGFAGQHVEE